MSKPNFERENKLSACGSLYIITGASGVGKGTIYDALLKMDIGLNKSISVTTRSPRVCEQHGVHYYFYTVEQFEQALAQDHFLEYAMVYGNYYGTPKHVVLDNLARNQDTILEIDLDGAQQIKSKYQDAVWIFIVPPDFKTLMHRLHSRNTDDEDTKQLRLSLYEKEMEVGRLADYVVVNDQLQQCLDIIVDIIQSKRKQNSPNDLLLS
ncbi:MAG: guanylate kinase [Clostridiales bacterium]|jgi:guanylate kinase|nr:guanylate kinase [Clostridiales bacterium]